MMLKIYVDIIKWKAGYKGIFRFSLILKRKNINYILFLYILERYKASFYCEHVLLV